MICWKAAFSIVTVYCQFIKIFWVGRPDPYIFELFERQNSMKYLKQFLIILVVSFIGEILNKYIPLPVPASIYGIVIMFLCLLFKIIKLEQVKDAADFLIAIMPVMFIPAGVGLIDSYGIIKDSILAYVVVTFISTVVVMAVSGLVTQLVIKLGKRGQSK